MKEGRIDLHIPDDVLNMLRKVLKQIHNVEGAAESLEETVEESSKGISKSISSNIITGFNQGLEVVTKFADSLDFTSEISALKTDISQFTELTGSELNQATAAVFKLSEEYDQNAKDIARSANAMSKRIGGSFLENVSLLTKGFQKGANLNDDLLKQMSEYPTFLKDLGLTAAQGLSLISQSSKDGVYDDKALDSLKEANLSIREMGANQVKALKGIGLEVEDLAGKTTFQAVQMISQSLEGASTQAKQLILADIFKGAGEDAGLSFIQGISSMNLDIDTLPSVQKAGAGIRGFASDVKSWLTNTFGDFSPYLASIGHFSVALLSIIQLTQTLGVVQKVQAGWAYIVTAAQWLWNAALTANPIGIIIVGIGALVAGIVWMVSNFEWFAEFFFGLWEGLKKYFIILVEFWAKYLNPFGWILQLVDYIFPGFIDSVKETFSKAFDWIWEVFVQPLIDAWNWIKEALGFGGETLEGVVNHNVNVNPAEPEPEPVVPDASAREIPTEGLAFSPTTPKGSKKVAGTSSGASGSSSGFSSAEKKSVNVHIESLGNITLYSQSVKEGAARIRKIIHEELIGAVRDTEISLSN